MSQSPELPPESIAPVPVPVLKLRHGEDRRLRAGHLWVFSNEVDVEATPLTAFESGAQVQVHSARDQFLGYGYVNPHALICARLVSRSPSSPLDDSLLEHRLKQAQQLRQNLDAEPFHRLVYGESDALPGLVLDRYGDVLVGQIATAGMDVLRPRLEAAIAAVLQPQTLIWRNNSSARDLEQLPKEVRVALGALPEELSVRECGLQYRVPFASAQKTGWFYDQSANRAQWMRLIRPGMRVLDACSYAGAWAISALAAGAREAVCIDSSETALQCAQRNAVLNGRALGVHHGDVFDALDELQRRGERFDAVVLDPPAFIKRRKDLPRGQAAYRKLNQLAMRLLDRDALLVSCSCSYHLPPEELLRLIQAAARTTGRFAQVLAVGGQSPDHPLHPAIPETRYLKAFFCRVTRE